MLHDTLPGNEYYASTWREKSSAGIADALNAVQNTNGASVLQRTDPKLR